MTEAANVSDDWELCKENVQPLRQGRSFTEMSAAIQPSNATRIKQEQEYVGVGKMRNCGMRNALLNGLKTALRFKAK